MFRKAITVFALYAILTGLIAPGGVDIAVAGVEAMLGKCDTVRWTCSKSGHALYYTDRAMARVGAIRVRQGYIKRVLSRGQVAGYTAVTDCSKVGWIAYISLNGGPVERYQILDCSQPYHAAGHVRARRVAEVDASSFVRNGCKLSRGRCPATLWDIRRH